MSDIDQWEELKEAWFKFLELNSIKSTEKTRLASLHTMVGVMCMQRENFLGTERRNEDLRNHLLRSDNSRSGKGLVANSMIMILKKIINDKEIIISKKLTEAGLIGGYEGQGKKRLPVFGSCSKLLICRDEFHQDLDKQSPEDDVLGTIRMNCNNYKSYDNFLKNSARSQADFPGFYGRATFMVTITPDKMKQRKDQLVEEGTFQRFMIDADEITMERSEDIFNSMKKSNMSKSERIDLHKEQIKQENRVLQILNEISYKKVVYINDDYLNGVIDNVKEKVKKYFEVGERQGQYAHSIHVNSINQITKCAGRIAIVRGKKSIGLEELKESETFVNELTEHNLEVLEIFSSNTLELSKLIRDCRNVLGGELHTKERINVLMGDYWKCRRNIVLLRLKKVQSAFIKTDNVQTVTQSNGQNRHINLWKLKSK